MKISIEKMLLCCAVVLSMMSICSKLSAQSYDNPIIKGFNPDPSICRVGDDFYMVSSSFEYFPGVPVYHSRDLVNWELIGHVLDRAEQLNLDSVRCNGGIFAPTIRYNNDTYYMITTLIGQYKYGGGNFIVTAKNPAGPWSKPYWLKDTPGIDPSLFFDDDGKAYYCGNLQPKNKVWDAHRNIWIQELDLKTMQLTGQRVEVLDGSQYYKKGGIGAAIESGVNNYEGPHIYKKEGLYYLLVSHGGTAENHAVSIWSSSNVFGPYTLSDNSPIMTHRDLSATFDITSVGHADIVDTPRGDWFMVYLLKRPHLGLYHPLGRETGMTPLDWSGKYPVVNPHGYVGRAERSHAIPDLSKFEAVKIPDLDNFEGEELLKDWMMLRTPRTQWWSLTERKGWLRLKVRPESFTKLEQPSLLCKRRKSFDFTASTKMEFQPAPNQQAGIVMMRDKDNYIAFCITNDGTKNRVDVIKQQAGETTPQLLASSNTSSKVHYLKVEVKDEKYTMLYSSNGKQWHSVLSSYQNFMFGEKSGMMFTGSVVGLYAGSNGEPADNHADIDLFEMVAK